MNRSLRSTRWPVAFGARLLFSARSCILAGVQRAVRVSLLWSWLPAFRTVAETEHLPTAAKVLELSPSALSRSVKQLEERLGEELFTRDGRRMKLNRAGERLLVAVRDAMRRIDDGIEQASSPSTDRIRVAGPAHWIQLIVVPAITATPGEPPVMVEVEDIAPHDISHALLRGDIDLALCDAIGAHDQLRIERLGEVRRGMCWSAGVARGAELSVAACTTDGPDDVAERDRGRVVLRTRSLPLVIEVCRAGQLRAVLPTVIARAHGLHVREDRDLRVSQLELVQRAPLVAAPESPFVQRVRSRARALFG